jgi:ABC-2 type transport system ATP-binding protein
VNVEPDILLVDEVLSVGDEAFQRKCIERVKKFQQEGRTILFVTHAADLVRRICDRAIVLDHGEMVIDATPGEAVRVFRESLHGGELNEPDEPPETEAAEEEGDESTDRGATYRVRITNVEIDHPGLLLDRNWLLPDEAMTVRVSYHATERTDDILFGIAIHDEDGNHLFGTNTAVLGVDVPPADGDGEMSFEFHRVPLLDGTYLVTLAIQSVDEGTVYDWREQQAHFEVMNPSRTGGLVSFPIDVRFGDPAMEPAEGTGA